jgi:hypothetical protein
VVDKEQANFCEFFQLGIAPAPGVVGDAGGAQAWMLAWMGIAIAAACSHDDPGRAAAERFVDAYYVEIDLPRARDEAVGLARAKVEDQIRLLAGEPAIEASARPSVHYRFLEQQKKGAERDRRGFLFEITISLGGDALTRRALITVRDEGGAWRAANFQEID